ncbi:MAG: hypothetical protein IPH61_14385 [Bacteroidetes bacterium]|nr:hypothetical protein [Bacteroidota bacterium]
MMYILLMKRLESSWFSFKNTVENILNHHTNALAKVNEFIEKKVDTSIEDNLTEEEKEELEDSVSESENNSQEEPPITLSETHDGYSGEKFEEILERFAPFTKLYNEKDWTELYENNLTDEFREGEKWKVPFEKWLQLIKDNDKKTQKKISNPIDVLIATDCLSEGQNLQDCDTVVNYDIHWNPVRLIQRMGRIDRIGSMNDTIRGINFWPGKNYEDYLRLKKRVEERMALMSVVGTELQDITPEFQKMVEENPLLPKQAQKMLDQLQITWDDIETNDETLGLNDLSMEQFRQELFEFFKQNEDFLSRCQMQFSQGLNSEQIKSGKQFPTALLLFWAIRENPMKAPNIFMMKFICCINPFQREKKRTQWF